MRVLSGLDKAKPAGVSPVPTPAARTKPASAAGRRALASCVVAQPLTFYEFFAGGGMAALGLGEAWTCAFANDFDARKAATYRANFPEAAHHLREGDVWA